MKKTFYLMRHGQTLFNVRRKIQGACDSPLTEVGIKQAIIASKYFEDITLDHLYCSTAERTSDTLELVIKDRAYVRLKGLKERDHGTLEGESEDLNPKTLEDYDLILPKYGGETSTQVTQRMVNTCTDFMESSDHQNVLAVSHTGACMSFLSAWMEENPRVSLFPTGMQNCTILKFEYEDKNFNLVEVIKHDFTELGL